MTVEPGRAMLERLYREADIAPANDDVLELYADRILMNGAEMSARTWQSVARRWYAAFPDAVHQLLDVTLEDDRVFNRYTVTATHAGDFWANWRTALLPKRRVALRGRCEGVRAISVAAARYRVHPQNPLRHFCRGGDAGI